MKDLVGKVQDNHVIMDKKDFFIMGWTVLAFQSGNVIEVLVTI
jgi:hypothetical protein